MELQNEVLTDKTVTINDVIIPDKFSSLEKQSKVYSTRRILLILISILLVSEESKILSIETKFFFFVVH